MLAFVLFVMDCGVFHMLKPKGNFQNNDMHGEGTMHLLC